MKKMTHLKSATLDSIEAIVVDIEATFTTGMPSFSIVGRGNLEIQESKDRVKSSLLMNEFKFPPKKITINLSPSEVIKKGSHLDASIALLIALHDKNVNFEDFFVFGELGLDGSLKDTSSIFLLILSLAKHGKIKNVLIPKESIEKISMIPNITIFAVENLAEAIEFFTTKDEETKSKYTIENRSYLYPSICIDGVDYFYDKRYNLDFRDVKGQKIAKRAALISVAGNHNILFEGSPGCGKSMITKRMRYTMPPMSLEEILEKAKTEVLGGADADFRPIRTFHSPHHTSTKGSILGGSKIGIISLSNNGAMFFDELPHFSKDIIEALREPLEDHVILVSRVNTKVKYDAKFLFIGAMNPCPCGNLLSKTKECRCNELEINRYKNRLSDPFLDRIDLIVTMGEVNSEDKGDIDSETIHSLVLEAFVRQKQRGQKELNGKLSELDIEKYCILDDQLQTILDRAIAQFSLSFRAINKVLKVARTIADIEKSDHIKKEHLFEALSYRRR